MPRPFAQSQWQPERDARCSIHSARSFGAEIHGFLRKANRLIALLPQGRSYAYQNVERARSLGLEASTGWTSPQEYFAVDGTGLKFDLWPTVSVLPEVGAYWDEGRLASEDMSGPGFQYGLMFATVF